MFKRVLLTTVFVLVLAISSAQSDLAAGDSWNQHADDYNFAHYPMSPNLTAAQAHSGGNYDADAAGIVAAVSDDLNRALPPIKGNDLISITISGW